MSEVQTLRVFIRQRLSAAAEEILELWERMLEEAVRPQHKATLLHAAFNPQVRLHRADIQHLLGSRGQDPPEQQEWSPSRVLEAQTGTGSPELPHSEEEQEDDITESTSALVPLKTEDDDEEKPQSSRLHQSQTEENGGTEPLRTDAEPDGNSNPDTHKETSQSSEPDTDESCDLEETSEPQCGLNPTPPLNHEQPPPESSTPADMMEKGKQRPELVAMKKKHMAASSSDDEDSDVEKNFALLTERGGVEEGERYHEEDCSDEDGSDGGEEDEEGSDAGEGEEDGGEEQQEEEDGVSAASDDDDDDDDDDEDEEEPQEAGGSGQIQTREDIKSELSNMSFEEILKLQNKVGTKVYNEVAYGGGKSGGARRKKRLNKNRPMEISAKRPAPFLRQVVAVRKPTLRDPRFDDLSGEYKPEIFEKTYKFIDDIRQREKEVVQKQLKKTKKSNERKEKLQFLLKRMENQERARKNREQQRERELHFKRQQRELANQGARPFFLKSSDKKKLQLAEKYQELKKSGKLENFLSKKRKRNAGKDRRKLPKQLQNQKAA